jgi:pyruvate,water dikinase
MAMPSFWSALDFFTKKRQQKALREEDDKKLFVERYQSLRELLKHNNEVLLNMGDMQEKASGAFVFDKAYIETSCKKIAHGIKSIIDNLNILADERYRNLVIPFQSIEAAVSSRLAAKMTIPKTDYVLSLQQLSREAIASAGGKMAPLGELANMLNLPVPPGFVVSTYAYQTFLEYNGIQAIVQSKMRKLDIRDYKALQAVSEEMQSMVREGGIPPDVEQAIQDGYRRLCDQAGEKNVMVAVRSSALHEDILASFAGQYESALNVSSGNLLAEYKNVLASQFTPRALFYFRDKGFEIEQMAMAVGVLAMVQAEASGILYTRDPGDPERHDMLITAVWGLGPYAVGGVVPTDDYRISKKDMAITTGEKKTPQETMLVGRPEGGTQEAAVPHERAGKPRLNDERIKDLVSGAQRVEEYFGQPQDMEWAMDDKGQLYFLQSRPLRLRALEPEQDRRHAIVVEGHTVLLDKGSIASRGVAAGPVYIARREEDLAHFPDGGVLVTRHSYPEFAAVLQKASAVVSDIGSVLGHLATVARECRVPALFNTDRATKKLRNGMEVTVDAAYGHVYDGIVDELLKEKDKDIAFETSPVLKQLREIMEYITPLNLVDPRGPDFRPEKCQTFHDITRFAHEVSLKAMLDLSKESHFSDRSTKRLASAGVPLQWWVIDLEDGIQPGVTGKKVEPGQIVSIPMRALWDGMTALPWKGPPPVDAKGFLSVMFSATKDPKIDPAVGRRFAEKNYIIVSKHFCNVSTRLGFHFSTLEAHLCDEENLNYITFVFTGGGAEADRKNRRAALISRLLEEFDFRVEVRGEAVFARIEGHKQAFMEDRLMVLGHIMVHTRQMDMVMYNDAMVDYYYKNILKDTLALVSNPF